MKQFYFFALASAMSVSTLNAQIVYDTITFENYPLDPMTGYFNGSTLDEGVSTYVIDYCTFDIDYNTMYSSWSGYAVSNFKDSTSVMMNNQYAAYPFSGANNSEKYGIFYPMFGKQATIVFDTIRTLSSLQITNTTYAMLTMRNGNPISKKFGSPNNAAGTADGTEGKDWFLLKIIPLNENDQLVGDTIKFYLADYRFDDASKNYIVDTWKNVSLGNVKAKKLTFELSSSDTGDFGMNTPSYFAFDNLTTTKSDLPSAGIVSANVMNVSAYPNPASESITVRVEQPAQLTLINALGTEVKTQTINETQTINVSDLPKGLYFLSVKSERGSATQKIILQ